MAKKRIGMVWEILVLFLAVSIFLIPFYFILITSMKSKAEAGLMQITWPSKFFMLQNYLEVMTYRNGIVFRAFRNSILLTILSTLGIIISSSMFSFVMQRRKMRKRGKSMMNFLVMIGLIIPPAIVPTYWILNALQVYGSLFSLILVEIAINFSYSTMLYVAFFETLPISLDEAATIDGCSSLRLFFQILFPLLQPVTITISILSMVNIYNDFVNPLYFLPGSKNVTAQLTLYYFQGQFDSSWHLLFADVVLISIPPLVFYIIFNRKMISGMTAGAVKG
jgi:raffinose/stachyose/melibiose transport system permease protein